MPLTTMLDPMETEDTTHRSVLDNLHGSDKGTYKVATGTRKEVEGLRIAVRNAGYQVKAKRNKDGGEDEYMLIVTVKGGVNEDEPQADPEPDTSTDDTSDTIDDIPYPEDQPKRNKRNKQDEQPADVAAAPL